MKSQKGITLITVIITVIVMIILAGISINLSIGNNGIINKAEKAAEKNDKAESKEYILEAWGYVLSKVDDNTMPYNDTSTKTNELGDQLFRKYISSYGTGHFEVKNKNYIFKIKVTDEDDENYNTNFDSYKINFKLKGNSEQKYFYIVHDTIVYAEDQVSEM